MGMRPFIAFIRKQQDAQYRVFFPDFPDFAPTGRTIGEAQFNAERTLALHCHLLEDSGASVPTPSYMHELRARREATEGLVVLIAPPNLHERQTAFAAR